MKVAYFIYQDNEAIGRQSDGVEFCLIPEFNDNHIYFYCAEYMVFWDSIENVGNLSLSKDYKLRNKIVPATLVEICNNNLISYVNLVKEYNILNNKIVNVIYVTLPTN